MTDKEFVLSLYPSAVCDGELSERMTGVVRYAIFLDDDNPRTAISAFWSSSEDQAWTDVANFQRAACLRKFEL